MSPSSNGGESNFLRQLASSDKSIRDNALETLTEYLRTRSGFDELELLKLWKGLFYCMWLSDRPLPQQQLARDLAGLVQECRPNVVMPFVGAFWETMAREWAGIDSLRMDKYLYLARLFLRASFSHISRHDWTLHADVEACMKVLQETPLNVDRTDVPDGLRYHIIDIYVDELEHVEKDVEADMPLETLLKPLQALQKYSANKKVRERAKEALEDERIVELRGG